MKVVIQRVKKASVKSAHHQASISQGFLILVAAARTDTIEDVQYLARKTAKLRIMADDQGLMNKNLKETGGEILLISQFTLFARTRKGNRPSFIDAAEPELAEKLYQDFIKELQQYQIPVKTGCFGDYMQVSLTNDGPVTIIIDSQQRLETRQ